MTKTSIKKFQKEIYRYYRTHGRELPWRRSWDPYEIVISEIMLQQTQVARVLVKYPQFLKKFPSFSALARARLARVLAAWQGLGYNRRAVALKRLAEIVFEKYQGKLPKNFVQLTALPGVGTYTAGAILAFAHNIPTPIIETNIRRVYIHFFFREKVSVRDADVLELVEETMDSKNPREWYYALMDYGAMLAKTQGNPNRLSAHYTRQSRFDGSRRQIRGKILKTLLEKGPITEADLRGFFSASKHSLEKVLSGLSNEGFIQRKNRIVKIA